MNGIHFTRREIDVMACLLHARGTSKIASLLNISPTTVVTHIQNVMEKLKCNSREGIIDFAERSHNLFIIKRYYAHLVVHTSFEKALKSCSRMTVSSLEAFNPITLIVYCKSSPHKETVPGPLRAHLKLAGNEVNVCLEFSPGGDAENKKRPQKSPQTSSLILILEKGSEIPQELHNVDFVDFSDQENYYFGVIDILKKLCPKIDFDGIFLEFKRVYETMEESSKLFPTHALLTQPSSLEKTHIDENIVHAKRKHRKIINKLVRQALSNLKKPFYIPAFLFIGLFGIGLGIGILVFQKIQESNKNQGQTILQLLPIRSDLIIPQESVLLPRSDLMNQINDKFKNKKSKGVQTIALVGPGGSGKTTLARGFAYQQKSTIIWEINAETHESLGASFESLAQALSQTDNDKKELRGILRIKDLPKREESLLQFVKKHLNSTPGWVLIYDNVENFVDVQDYFPRDRVTWGEGKVILTTRDGNIQNNTHIHEIIHIRNLTLAQKLTLFTKIMRHGSTNPSVSLQNDEVKRFLEKIPSFPLDVSVAAYYLKTTNISYSRYLQNLIQYSKHFETIQKNLLKEAGNYTKTRYSLITLSLQKLIDTHKDFSDLLLFISLLDSQNIPRDLLEKYKNQHVVDNFIYNLKKYSFITNESLPGSLNSTFSIHRNVQAISLLYLKKTLELENDKHSLQSIAEVLDNYLVNTVERDELSIMRLLYGHYETFLGHNDLLTDEIKGLLKGQLGIVNLCLANYVKSNICLEQSLKKLNRQDKKSLLRIAYLLRHLGRSNEYLGNYEIALSLLEQSLAIYKRYLPKTADEVAKSLIHLGRINRISGHYKESIDLCEKSLSIYKIYSPPNDLNIAQALANLGRTYFVLGHHEKAKNLFKQSLAIYKQNFGENHVGTAWCLIGLAMIASELGDNEQAKNLIEQSHIIYKKNFSENDAAIAFLLNCLGNVYICLGDYKKAKGFLERSLKIHESNFDKNNILTAQVLRDLGHLYFLENQFKMAEDLVTKALRVLQQNNHPESYMCLEILSDLYHAKSRQAKNKKGIQQSQDLNKQALVYLKQAMEIVNAHFPKDSPHVMRLQSKLKSLKESRG